MIISFLLPSPSFPLGLNPGLGGNPSPPSEGPGKPPGNPPGGPFLPFFPGTNHLDCFFFCFTPHEKLPPLILIAYSPFSS